jgi:hypothetical protein
MTLLVDCRPQVTGGGLTTHGMGLATIVTVYASAAFLRSARRHRMELELGLHRGHHALYDMVSDVSAEELPQRSCQNPTRSNDWSELCRGSRTWALGPQVYYLKLETQFTARGALVQLQYVSYILHPSVTLFVQGTLQL